MEKKKLPSVFQHSHAILHSIPGDSTWGGKGHGDRYLQGYKSANGKIQRWTPTTGVVLEHSHALLRNVLTDNTIATYDFMDYKGCLLYTSPSPRDRISSRMPSSA